MSSPLLISAVKLTRSWAASPPAPAKERETPHARSMDDMKVFTCTVWHEIGHRYVDDILESSGGSPPLLIKYAGENQMIRFHLHLMALDKLVYTRLGRGAEYDARVAQKLRPGLRLSCGCSTSSRPKAPGSSWTSSGQRARPTGGEPPTGDRSSCAGAAAFALPAVWAKETRAPRVAAVCCTAQRGGHGSSPTSRAPPRTPCAPAARPSASGTAHPAPQGACDERFPLRGRRTGL